MFYLKGVDILWIRYPINIKINLCTGQVDNGVGDMPLQCIWGDMPLQCIWGLLVILKYHNKPEDWECKEFVADCLYKWNDI